MDTDDNTPLYCYRVGRIEFDEARFELRVGGEPAKLEPKPLLVLAELLRHPDEVVTRQQLLDTVWSGRLMVDQALANAIVKLRKAVHDRSGNVIVTVARQGFKLVGPVERIAVGHRLRTQLELTAGELVPGRRDVLLESQLHATPGGEVWLARHATSGDRRVFKFSRDAEGLLVLKHEADILRALHHGLGMRGDLVQMLSCNFEKPPFYIECEYGGVDLANWASENRLAALSLEQRLKLFLQIAAAVQAMHSVAVLHRDIRPANILVVPGVSELPRIRLADFSSARRLPKGGGAESELRWGAAGTETSGTPLHLPPEVAEGKPTTICSDVYALGLLLYQIVTANLRRPFAPGWEAEITDVLLREDITAATAPVPAARLSSVDELMQRLQSREARERQRLDTAISAERAALAERALQRTRARRPWLIAAIASLFIGMSTSLWLYFAESAARHESERQTRRLQEVNNFINDLLGAADPNRPGGAAKTPLEDVLTPARSKLDGQLAGDPFIKGSLYATLGEVYYGLGEYADALTMQEQASRLLSASVGPQDEATLTVQYQAARTLGMLTRHAAAQELVERTDREAGKRLREDSMLTLLAHWTAGAVTLMQMQPARAFEAFKAAEAVRARVAPQDDAWLIRVRADMAWCDVRMQRHADALEALRDLMAPEYTPERIGVGAWAKVHLQAALALMTLHEYAQAEQVTRDAIAEIQRVVGPDHYLVGLGWNHLAAVLKANASWERALDAARRAHRIFSSAMEPNNRATLAARADLAVLEYLSGNSKDAVLQLASVHASLESALGAESPVTQYVDYYWANALVDLGDVATAADLFEMLDAADLNAMDPGIDWDLRLQGLQGRILLAGGRKDAGRALLQAAVSKLSQRNVEPWVIKAFQRDLERDRME
jgi:non-specific serine/threonine protein kinase